MENTDDSVAGVSSKILNEADSEDPEDDVKKELINTTLLSHHCHTGKKKTTDYNSVTISLDDFNKLEKVKSHDDNYLPKKTSEVDNTRESSNKSDTLQSIGITTPIKIFESKPIENECNVMREELQQYKDICEDFKIQLDQFKLELQHKNDFIKLIEREKFILEKEKHMLKTQVHSAIKDKENIVISFATKEKNLLDAKKEKEVIEKQLTETKRDIKNLTIKFQNLSEEKSRIAYLVEEKCIEIKKQKFEIDKYKQDIIHLETKLKLNSVKLNEEIENKLAIEKKLEEGPNKLDEKETEQKRIEYEASMILLKHDISSKEKMLDNLRKDYKFLTDKSTNLQEKLTKEIEKKDLLFNDMENLKLDHTNVQNQLSHELLNSAKLRGQLEELCLLKTQNTINEEKVLELNKIIENLDEKISIYDEDINQLRLKNNELLSINKELSEITVNLQNKILLQTSKIQGNQAELDIYKKEKLGYDLKLNEISTKLKTEIDKRNEERVLLSKHLSEKTKLYEQTKQKLENALGDLEAVKKKHTQVFKELNREIQKYKKYNENVTSSDQQGSSSSFRKESHSSNEDLLNQPTENYSHQSSGCESDGTNNISSNHQSTQEPTTQHLVNRILRLQQAAARQTEKIDFLENHTMTLVSELQKKSKLIQYYMMRDQTGALTSSKMDQNKTELAKYGGVMSAIYSGIKGQNSCNNSPTTMTLELSLEINKKLQAVLEDTLLKNITLKENLDVMGLEIDKLTKQLAQHSRL